MDISKKKVRELILKKTDGHCAYCGCILKDRFHIDHINPIYRGYTDIELNRYNIVRGTNDYDNLLASCQRCNIMKGTYSVEKFRNDLKLKLQRIKRDSTTYRVLLDYGLIKEIDKNIVFYFETLYLD